MMKESRKKILMICSSLDGGGAARIISNITTHLPEEWEIDILLNTDRNIQFPFRGNIISLNILEFGSRTNLIYQGRVFIKRLMVLFKLKRENCYAACISYMDSANAANLLTGNRFCEVILNIVNNMSAKNANEPIYRWLITPMIKLLYNKADKVIALSEEVKEDMIRNFGLKQNKMFVSYCSIDIADIEDKIAQKLSDGKSDWFIRDKTVVTAGRLEKQKGQWHLIRAFSEVIKRVPDAKLVIFGSGSLQSYFEKLVLDYKMENNVLLYGFSNNLDYYIARSAVFVFPSLYEGFGTALQEALACNIPCIATDYISGAREQLAPDYKGDICGYLKTEYGIIVEGCSEEMCDASVPLDSSEQGMVEAIIELLQSEELRCFYAQKAKVRSRVYDIEEICRKWIEIIEA